MPRCLALRKLSVGRAQCRRAASTSLSLQLCSVHGHIADVEMVTIDFDTDAESVEDDSKGEGSEVVIGARVERDPAADVGVDPSPGAPVSLDIAAKLDLLFVRLGELESSSDKSNAQIGRAHV